MKKYVPTPRLTELVLVQKYNKEVFKCSLKEESFLSWNECLLITRERARIMAGDNSYKQTEILENKIQAILKTIKESDWKPENELQYD